MDWYTLARFVAATLLVLATPGPVMAIVFHNTLRHGTTAGLLTVVGVELGDACLLGATFAGLKLSGEHLPVVFRWLSLTGALYLTWLAAEALLVHHDTSRKPNLSRCRKPILDGLTIVFANPAVLLFYAVFLPQFIDPDHSISEQMIALSALYVLHRLGFRLRLRPHCCAPPITGGLEHTDWQVRGIGKCRRLSFDRGHHRPQVLRGVRVICGGRPHTRQRRHVAQLEIRAALRAGKLPDDALVFPAPLKGGYQSTRAFSKEWADVAESIGVPEVTFQALRHTHASQLIDAGVDIVTISKRLGHASPNITLKVHAHLFRKDDSKASDAIDAALEAPGAS